MFQNKKILILGFARSGYEAAKVLIKRGNTVVLNDNKNEELQDQEKIKELKELGVEFVFGSHPDDLLDSSFDYLIKNPGVPIHHKYVLKARDFGIEVINEVEMAYRLFPDNITLIAITGTNGKTTTAYFIYEAFNKLGIKHVIINNNPDGININRNCGSTHLEGLKEYVVKNKMSLGIAYDGDGDRCLAVDEKGNVIDGDMFLAIVSNYLKEKEKLNKNTIVATVMSNLGLNKYATSNNLTLKQTKVGDRYVLEEMLTNGYNLGGEQSGHIIFLDYNPTGDGILTSLMLIQILLEKNIKPSEACNIISIYPQVLVNAKVNNEKKNNFNEDLENKKEIEKLEKEFAGNGRVLIRPSGTEPLIRVMIEGENQDYINTKAKELANFIEEKLK